MDSITTDVLSKLSELFPNKSVTLTHKFLDGEDGTVCGFVPNTCDGSHVVVKGQWWNYGNP